MVMVRQYPRLSSLASIGRYPIRACFCVAEVCGTPSAGDNGRARWPLSSDGLGRAKRAGGRIASMAMFAVGLLLPAAARAEVGRCAGILNGNPCATATGSCPAFSPAGLTDTVWPVFQHDLQHTGKSGVSGPSCAQPTILWKTRIPRGGIYSAPVIGPAAPGQQGVVYVGAAKNPMCALEPSAGSILWCNTGVEAITVYYGAPALGNDLVYLGTRDNDLWAIDPAPAQPSPYPASLVWRQKVCTDGDVSTPPIIGADGVVYFGSDSLEGGTIMAMCPGPDQRVKWCVNPVGGAVTNVSPALSPDGSRLYVTFFGNSLVAYDAATGQQKWKVKIESRHNNGKATNSSPVVNPITGRIYLGFDEGIFAIDTQVNPATHKETPIVSLLFSTQRTARERVNSPPALDVANQALYFGATRRRQGTIYAISLSGQLKWKRALGKGRFANNPPAIDASGRVYVALFDQLFALAPQTGSVLWQQPLPNPTLASPVIDHGRIYVGTKRGRRMVAIGCVP